MFKTKHSSPNFVTYSTYCNFKGIASYQWGKTSRRQNEEAEKALEAINSKLKYVDDIGNFLRVILSPRHATLK